MTFTLRNPFFTSLPFLLFPLNKKISSYKLKLTTPAITKPYQLISSSYLLNMRNHLPALQHWLSRLYCRKPSFFTNSTTSIQYHHHHHSRPFSSLPSSIATITNPSSPCLWFPRFNRLEPNHDPNGANLPRVVYSVGDCDIELPEMPDSYHLLRATDKKIVEVKIIWGCLEMTSFHWTVVVVLVLPMDG